MDTGIHISDLKTVLLVTSYNINDNSKYITNNYYTCNSIILISKSVVWLSCDPVTNSKINK